MLTCSGNHTQHKSHESNYVLNAQDQLFAPWYNRTSATFIVKRKKETQPAEAEFLIPVNFTSLWQSIKRMKWTSNITHFVEVTLLSSGGDKAVTRMKCLKDPWTQDSFSSTNTTDQGPPPEEPSALTKVTVINYIHRKIWEDIFQKSSFLIKD